jgi:hypothetical protein
LQESYPIWRTYLGCRYNYGHYTTLMDSWYGTLLAPEDYPAWLSSRSRQSAKKGEAGVKLVAVDAALRA